MRKKANEADLYYIRNHYNLPAQAISEIIDLVVSEIEPHLKSAKKDKKLGRSKIMTKSGPVYQLTEDIDKRPTKKNKTYKPGEVRSDGIYESPKD